MRNINVSNTSGMKTQTKLEILLPITNVEARLKIREMLNQIEMTEHKVDQVMFTPNYIVNGDYLIITANIQTEPEIKFYMYRTLNSMVEKNEITSYETE